MTGAWRLCASDTHAKRTWHFFRATEARSICGHAAGYQQVASEAPLAAMSTYGLIRGQFCGRCDRVRRPIEGR
jgi:hypothetical protein